MDIHADNPREKLEPPYGVKATHKKPLQRHRKMPPIPGNGRHGSKQSPSIFASFFIGMIDYFSNRQEAAL